MGFKDQFYALLKCQKDDPDSFLYAYLRQERERHPRLYVRNHFYDTMCGKATSEQFVKSVLRLIREERTLQDLCVSDAPPEGLGALLSLLSLSPRPDETKTKRLRRLREALQPLAHETARLPLTEEQCELLCRPLLSAVLDAFPCNEKRNNRYVLLRERQLGLLCGEETDVPAYLAELLALAIELKPQDGEQLSVTICSIRSAFPGLPAPSGKAGSSAKKELELLLDTVRRSGQDTALYDQIPPEALTALTDQILIELLRKDAGAFLYDAGYSDSDSAAVSYQRRSDGTMDMINAFFEQQPGAFYRISEDSNRLRAPEELTPTAGAVLRESLSQQQKQEFNALFKLLDQKSQEGVILPLIIDPVTGTGLYITGKKYTRRVGGNLAAYYAEDHHCCYNVLGPNDMGESHIGHGYELRSYAEFNSAQAFEGSRLEEAYSYFYVTVRDDDPDALFVFRESNGEGLYGLPDTYRKYFELSETVEDEAYIKDMQEEERLKQQYRKEKKALSRKPNPTHRNTMGKPSSF